MNELTIKVRAIDDKLKFSAASNDDPQVVVDYVPPLGSGEGYTPLELVMMSLATCVSSVLLSLLRNKKKRTVDGFSAVATGTVREVHPKALSHIHLAFDITAADTTVEEIEQLLQVSEEKLCPVWAMLRGNVEISWDVQVHDAVR